MIVGAEKTHKEATDALKRVQEFDVETLPREADLGSKLNFKDAVAPARSLVELFQRLSIQALEDFPNDVLTLIRDASNNVYKIFKDMLDFDPATQGNPQSVRDSLNTTLRNTYGGAFQQLHPYISYSLHRAADFQRLDAQARAALQSVQDQADGFAATMEKYEKDAAGVLEAIRKVAAEEGVTQQAVHFRKEADDHETQAEVWRGRMVKLAVGLGVYAAASIFLHKIPFLEPHSAYETVQLTTSKVLVFAVIAYMVLLAARNFMNHRHNAVVNRHRQNALMTHKALVEAVNDLGARDAVMMQAANCVFSPQPTGYASAGSESEGGAPRSVVELLSKQVAPAK